MVVGGMKSRFLHSVSRHSVRNMLKFNKKLTKYCMDVRDVVSDQRSDYANM